MAETYRSWPGPARTMARAVDAAVAAATSADAVAFAAARADLALVDREQLAVLLGAMTRDLLERAHPDGLDSEDAEVVLDRCTRAAAVWYEQFDLDMLLRALAGALGLTDPDETPPISGAAVVAHGVLLISDLLAALRAEVSPAVEAALRELMRAQTIEMP